MIYIILLSQSLALGISLWLSFIVVYNLAAVMGDREMDPRTLDNASRTEFLCAASWALFYLFLQAVQVLQ